MRNLPSRIMWLVLSKMFAKLLPCFAVFCHVLPCFAVFWSAFLLHVPFSALFAGARVVRGPSAPRGGLGEGRLAGGSPRQPVGRGFPRVRFPRGRRGGGSPEVQRKPLGDKGKAGLSAMRLALFGSSWSLTTVLLGKFERALDLFCTKGQSCDLFHTLQSLSQ